VARCFTGWRWNSDRNSPQRGAFLYDSRRHDDGAKTVLGQRIPAGGGQQDGFRVIDLLANHPATARYLAVKLVRRFVTDDPLAQAPALVETVAAAYAATGGDIKAMLRTILLSEAFFASFQSGGGRLSRPLDLVARSCRAMDLRAADLPLAADSQAWRNFARQVWSGSGYLRQMGHVPFGWPTPDGYPDRKESWIGSSSDLARWNFGLALADGEVVRNFRPASQRPGTIASPEAIVDYWVERLLHRAVEAQDRATLLDYLAPGGALPPANQMAAREAGLIALVLDSPYFQWR
jgi:uncharacterized protein (DUF1800 family)